MGSRLQKIVTVAVATVVAVAAALTSAHTARGADAQSARAGTVPTPIAPAQLLVAHSTVEQVEASLVQQIESSRYSPASPSPSGIAYIADSDRFLISDSEVDEMTIYRGANLYTATRDGSGVGTGTTLAFTNEPTGLSLDAATGALYVSDDDSDKIYIDRPGRDRRHGTDDDVVTAFSTSAFGSSDAEDVAYDPTSGHVFICDGAGREIFEVDPVNGVFGDANDRVTHFDTGVYGARDGEGLAINRARNTLLYVDPSTKKIYEFAKNGALVRIIDLSTIPTTHKAPAGVTLAPTSDPTDPPSRLNFWIVDRQVDNGSDPNENDGKLYEVSVPGMDDDTVPAAPAKPVSQPASVRVRGDVQIGRFLVRRNGKLAAAIRAFGKPTSLRRGRHGECTARWSRLGLRIDFYSRRGNPCLRRYGHAGNATMVGRHWVTARGLRPGDSARKLGVLYSPRRSVGSWAWLVTRRSRSGDDRAYAGLAAKVHRGSVTAFRIRYQPRGA